MLKLNCKICTYYRAEEIGDSDFGAVYSDTLTCSEDEDLNPETEEYITDFDYESEKKCCIPDFWSVIEKDEEIKKLFDEEVQLTGDLAPRNAYEKFKEKFKVKY